ncbi:Transcriptional regulator MraZ [bioreactor metagenome]|uniref:Transcriptional regulator MraZ n=1 Tax=bioreactor metagenome TaxID=1076179 RepID=A0A645FGI7_9ZZZZ
MVYASLDELSSDKQGRITLKEEFCVHACFDKDVMVLGSGKRIELWDKNEWDKMNEAIVNDENIEFEELPW